MKFPIVFVGVALAPLVLGIVHAQAPAQPLPAAAPAANPFAGPVGTPGLAVPPANFYRGTSRGPAFDDITLTNITRMEESFEKELAAVNPAREALLQATFILPRNEQNVRAKLDALMNAELALAMKRAEAFAKFQSTSKLTTAQLESLIASIASQQLGAIPRGGTATGGPPPVFNTSGAPRGK